MMSEEDKVLLEKLMHESQESFSNKLKRQMKEKRLSK